MKDRNWNAAQTREANDPGKVKGTPTIKQEILKWEKGKKVLQSEGLGSGSGDGDRKAGRTGLGRHGPARGLAET